MTNFPCLIPMTVIIEPHLLFLIQLVVIIVIAKLCGWLLGKLGQPSVLGEITAGIVLGPSLLGAAFPELSATLFPAASLNGLQYISQIGLVLFMFIVGMELNLNELKGEMRVVLAISISSIVVPLIIGSIFGAYLYQFFPPLKDYKIVPFALYIGIAFSITAFPVLARIVFERNIQKTRVGYLALSSAAINDCAAWFLLSAILAYIKTENLYDALIRFLCITAYLFFMFFFVKKLLYRFYQTLEHIFSIIILVTVLVSSILSELLGIHALFGAFIAGLLISDMKFNKTELILKLHDVSIILFLPAFFAISGLRTSIGLINNKDMVYAFGFIMLVAVSGKLAASALASKFCGLNWRDSISIGVLMNTRGLIELIILNIGYDLGLIGPTLFTILVLMALVTTFMTGPLLSLVKKIKIP